MSAPVGEAPPVLVRPPVLYAGALLLAWGLARLVPVTTPWWPPGTAGWVLVAAGVALVLAAAWQFRRAGTNVPTHMPVKALVTDGLYRISRNPIYIGLTLAYLGVSVLIGSAWAVVLLIPVLGIMDVGVIRREEAFLEAKFGEPYADYRRRVRRWI